MIYLSDDISFFVLLFVILYSIHRWNTGSPVGVACVCAKPIAEYRVHKVICRSGIQCVCVFEYVRGIRSKCVLHYVTLLVDECGSNSFNKLRKDRDKTEAHTHVSSSVTPKRARNTQTHTNLYVHRHYYQSLN